MSKAKQISSSKAAADDSSDDDVDVGYVDQPLVEEDSDEDDSPVPKKKQKVSELRKQRKAMQQEKKEKKLSEPEGQVSLVSADAQLDLLIACKGSAPPSLEGRLRATDFLEDPENRSSASMNMVDAIAFSGLKNLLKTGLLSLEAGCPLVLVVCPSAARCTQVIASISQRYHCRVAKLYAKHQKLPEQIEVLQTAVPVAVGTPSRVAKLIELGALRLSLCSMVLLDVTLDVKKFHLLTLAETKGDTFSLLHTSVLPELTHLKLGLIREQGEAPIVLKKPNQKPNWTPKVKPVAGAK